MIKYIKSDRKLKFNYKVLAETTRMIKITNFLKLISFNLDEDFEFNSYLTKEYATEIFKDFYFSINKEKNIDESIIANYNHQFVSEHKQSDLNAITMYATKEVKAERPQYQRDRDRIVHSKANRWLVDKAQIFTASKGDHYRTRMTHTIEVTQIARSIANLLGLNCDLTEAIALGHDLGHTPFGHQGERTLDLILTGQDSNHFPIVKNINTCESLKQRFKHNYQALRVLTFLESKYTTYNGLNLSYQVMEGIWKHTSISKKTGNVEFDLDDFFKYSHSEHLHVKCNYCSTLEGKLW